MGRMGSNRMGGTPHGWRRWPGERGGGGLPGPLYWITLARVRSALLDNTRVRSTVDGPASCLPAPRPPRSPIPVVWDILLVRTPPSYTPPSYAPRTACSRCPAPPVYNPDSGPSGPPPLPTICARRPACTLWESRNRGSVRPWMTQPVALPTARCCHR